MKIQVKLSSMLLVVMSSWLICLLPAEAYPQRDYTTTATNYRSHQAAFKASAVEDQVSAASGESGVDDDDSMCARCYDKVKLAQSFIAIYNGLEKEQKKLIAYRQQQMDASSLVQATASSISNTKRRKPTKAVVQYKNFTQSEPEWPTRDQVNQENKPIIISRLRVVRSTDDLEELSHSLALTGTTRQRDPTLKRLKHRQEKQLNKTCKSLHEVQQCLNEISEECIGDLQYHSHEVLIKQWLIRLNCPPINDPNFKPFGALTRSIPRFDNGEKTPLPRPLTTPEETKRRLDVILGSRSIGPFGVMLKPTLTRSASQKFDALGSSASVQTQQFSGFEQGQVKSRFQMTNLQNGPLPMTGQLLLIPALLVLMIVLISLAHRYFKQREF